MKHEVLACETLANGFLQVQLKLAEPALPGQYLEYQTHKLFIMGQTPTHTDFLIPPMLATQIGATLETTAVQGVPFAPPYKEEFKLMLAEDNALAALIFYFKKYRSTFSGLAIIGATSRFPFMPCPSRQIIAGMPNDVIAALPLFEDWGIAHRLACLEEMPGVFQGTADALAKIWQQRSSP